VQDGRTKPIEIAEDYKKEEIQGLIFGINGVIQSWKAPEPSALSTKKYIIRKMIPEIYARLDGKLTKIDIPVGTICSYSRTVEGFHKMYNNVVSCTIDTKKYTQIELPAAELDNTYAEYQDSFCAVAGGRRRPKKSRRSRSSRKRRQTRSK
jgi:hypothetical protein